MNLNIREEPNKSFICYEIILNIIVLVGCIGISFIIDMDIIKSYLGFFFGSLAVTIGFYLITVSADKVLTSCNDESEARMMSHKYLIFRYLIYFCIGFVAVKLECNMLMLLIGFMTIKLIIYLDHFKNGGEQY